MIAGEHRTPAGRGFDILLVDDEAAQRDLLSEILKSEGYRSTSVGSGEAAVEELKKKAYQLVITDLRMPGLDGMCLLEHAQSHFPDLPVLLMTAFGSVSSAVQAMQSGAYDYLQKPFQKTELIQRVRRVAERHSLVTENERLRTELGARATSTMLGNSSAMQVLRQRVGRLAKAPGDVLVFGESGTGKELVAQALHYGGGRASGPFVPVNCAAIPAELAESELFGHIKGAFTHAVSSREGCFVQADGGTLFLDEVSSMPLLLQVKLLRVIEDRTVQPVGAKEAVSVDIRIVAATNRDLPAMIARGEFREDLYHRLNVHELYLPPLRERGDDVTLLAEHFRDQAAVRFEVPAPILAQDLSQFIETFEFPGNVRQLRHMIDKMVVLSDGDPLTLDDLPPSIRKKPRGAIDGAGMFPISGSESQPEVGSRLGPGANPHDREQSRSGPQPEGLLSDGPVSLAEIEERLLREAIRRADGNLSEAARQLSISYKTMRYRARKLGLVEE